MIRIVALQSSTVNISKCSFANSVGHNTFQPSIFRKEITHSENTSLFSKIICFWQVAVLIFDSGINVKYAEFSSHNKNYDQLLNLS